MTASQAALRFSGTDPWYRQSDCGRYRITKVSVNGLGRYEVWERRNSGEWLPQRVNLATYAAALSVAGAAEQPGRFLEPGERMGGDGT